MSTKKNRHCVTLQMWRFFVSAIEKGSLCKAAEACGTDVAYLSREIRKLELLLREPLLQRSKRGVKPTWAGSQRYRIAVPLVHETNDLMTGFSKSSSERTQNTIRIAAPLSLSGLFVKWIAGFNSFTGRPKFPIDLVEYSGEPHQDLSRFDIFVCEKELPRVRVLAEPLGYMRSAIVVCADFLKSEPALNVPEDLIGRPLIAQKSERILMLSHGSTNTCLNPMDSSASKYFESIALPIEPTVKVNSVASLVESVRTGMGYAIGVPVWQVTEQLRNGELVQVLPNWNIAASPVWLMRQSCTATNNHITSLCRYFKECWNKTEGLEAPKTTPSFRTDIH